MRAVASGRLPAIQLKISKLVHPDRLLSLRIQPIDATHWLNRSAGVSWFNVFRGRSLSLACECTDRSVPWGIIVAGEFSEAVRYAASAISNLKLLTYQVQFSFDEAKI